MIVVKKKEISQEKKVTIYAKCRFPSCARYKISMTPIQDTQLFSVDVASDNKFNGKSHSQYSLYRQLRGTRRLAIMADIMSSTSLKVSNSQTMRENIVRNQFGNIDYLKSLPSLRRIKSDAFSLTILSSDDYMDLHKLKTLTSLLKPSDTNRTPPFIRCIQIPLSVLWFCDTQITTLIKNGPINGYLDSTGSVVRKSSLALLSYFIYIYVF